MAGYLFLGANYTMQVQEGQMQVTGDGGLTACCSSLSMSAEMSLFWEPSFERNNGRPGVMPGGGGAWWGVTSDCVFQRMLVRPGNLSPETIRSKVQ